MMKTHLFSVFLSACSLSAFSADLIGTWNIRNYNTTVPSLALGVFGEANSIQFKKNGTFFCNDTVSGTYVLKGDDLVLNRDKKQTKSFLKKHKEATEADKNDYSCDSLKISFSTKGNKALSLLTQNKYGVGENDLIGLIFELTKQGTNGENEDLNEGKSVIGKWGTSVDDITIILDLWENGVGTIIASSQSEGLAKILPCYYKINGSYISVKSPEMGQIYNNEFIIGKNCIYIIATEEEANVVLSIKKLPEKAETSAVNKIAKKVTTYKLEDNRFNGIKKGEIASMITYNEKDEVLDYYEPSSEESAIMMAKYDAKGNRFAECFFDIDGNLLEMNFIMYNENNKRTEEKKFVYEDDMLKYHSKYESKYNDEGLLIEERWLSSNDYLFHRDTYKYDKQGHEIEYCSYMDNGSLEEKTTNVYDKKGNCVVKNYSSDESSSKETFKYDVNGKVVEECSFYPVDKLNSKKTFKYNNGNLVEECHFNKSGKLSEKTTREYDTKGLLKKETMINDGEKTVIQYIRNDDGKVLEMHTYLPRQTVPAKVVNKYDANKNLIESYTYGTDGKLSKKKTYSSSKDKEEISDIEFEDGRFKSGELTVYEYFKQQE